MPRVVWSVVVAGLALLNALPAAAQDYPNRPITLVVPFPPGGSTSIVARIISDKLSEALGQQIVVDNRGGAGGTIGTRAVARSTPDGYTILLGYTGTLAIGPTLYPSAGYDPRKDFAPIGLIGHAPNSLVVHPSFAVHSVKELVAYAKANPGKVNYGSAGVGTVSHVSGVYFASAAGVSVTHIPYKGTGPALADLIGGHIPMAFAPIPATHANIAEGKLRGLAVTSAKRSEPAAGRADDRRGRRGGLRGLALLRPGRAGRHAASDRRSPEQGAARRARLRRGAQAACHRRGRAGTEHARGIRHAYRPGRDQVVQGGPGVGRQGGVTRCGPRSAR